MFDYIIPMCSWKCELDLEFLNFDLIKDAVYSLPFKIFLNKTRFFLNCLYFKGNFEICLILIGVPVKLASFILFV